MAEKIVSPGVFTREKDLSFLPQGIAEIGACIIGSTRKGPAFIPTLCDSMADFETKFGAVWEDSYVPFTVQQYLKSAGQVTIVRVLGDNGHICSKQIAFKLGSTTAATYASAGNAADASLIDIASGDSNPTVSGRTYVLTINGTAYTFESDNSSPVSTDVGTRYFFATGSTANESVEFLSNEINHKIGGSGGLGLVSASFDTGKIAITASNAGAAGNTITFSSGSHTSGETNTFGGGANSIGGKLVAVTAPAKGEGNNIGGEDQVGNYGGNYQTSDDGVQFPIAANSSSIALTLDAMFFCVVFFFKFFFIYFNSFTIKFYYYFVVFHILSFNIFYFF